MSRSLTLVYGVVAYATFLVVFAYFIGWVMGVAVPRAIDDGPPGSPWIASLVDLALLSAFGVQHSVMARPWFKRAWTVLVPEPAERSTYVLLSSLLLALIMVAWRPLPHLLWDLRGHPVGDLLLLTSGLGWAFMTVASFTIDHFHLYGLRQVVHHWLGRPTSEPVFRARGPYRLVRHPLMLGFLLAFWATPAMSVGHFGFALGMTAYILIALAHEERDLRAAHGAHYEQYAAATPRLNPFARRR